MSAAVGVGSKALVGVRAVGDSGATPVFLNGSTRGPEAELAALRRVFAEAALVEGDNDITPEQARNALARAPLAYVLMDHYDYLDFRDLILATPAALVVADGELAAWIARDGVDEARIIDRASAEKPLDSPILLGAAGVVCSVNVATAFPLARTIAAASGAYLIGVVTSPFAPAARAARMPARPAERIRDRIDQCDLVLWANHAMAAKWPARLNAVVGASIPDPVREGGGGIVVNVDFSEMDYSRRGVRAAKQWLDDVTNAARTAGVDIRIVKPPQYTAMPRDFPGVAVEATSFGAHLAALNSADVIITPYSRALKWAAAPDKTLHYFNLAMDSVADLNTFGQGAPPVIRRHQDLARTLKREQIPSSETWPAVALFGAGNPHHSRDALHAIATLLATEPAERANAAPPSDAAQSLARKRVMIVSRMPDMAYSGGRYHALMMAYALAHAGHDVTLVTDNFPLFTHDFALFAAAREVRVWLTRDFASDLPDEACDIVILVPGMDREDRIYRSTVNLAATAGARFVLMNFETPNWFNTLSSTKRDWALWRNWLTSSEYATAVLSSTEESVKFARAFFPPHVRHDAILGGVNTQAVAAAPAPAEREKRLLIFVSRARYGEHKGAGEIPQILSPALAGYTLVVMSGNDPLDDETREAIEGKAADCGMSVEYVERATDREKFAQYKRASLLLFPSTFEGYGYPPVEAMICGVGAVAFDLPVLRETGEGWYTFVPRGDYDAFRDAVAGAIVNVDAITPEDRAAAIARAEAAVGFEAYAGKLGEYVKAIVAAPARWDAEEDETPVSQRIQRRFELARPSLAVELDFAGAPAPIIPGLALGGDGARVLILAGRGAGQISREFDSALSALIYQLQSRNIAIDVLAAGNPPAVEWARWTRVFPLPPEENPSHFVVSLLRHYRYTTVLVTDSWLIEGRSLTRLASTATMARLNPVSTCDIVQSADLSLQTFDSSMVIGPDHYWMARQKSNARGPRAGSRPIVVLVDTEADCAAAEQFVWRYGDMLEKLVPGTLFRMVAATHDRVLNVRGRVPLRAEVGDENIRNAIATARMVIDFASDSAPGIERARTLKSLFGVPSLRVSSTSPDLLAAASEVIRLLQDDDAWLAASQTDDGLKLLAAPSPYIGLEDFIGVPGELQFPDLSHGGVMEALEREKQRAFTDPAWSAPLVAAMPGVRVLIDRLRDLEKLRTQSDRDLAFVYASRLARATDGIEWAQAMVLRLAIELRRSAEVVDIAQAFLAAFPLDSDARIFSARALAAAGEFEAALTLLERGLNAERPDSQLHIEILLVLAALGRLTPKDGMRDVRNRMAPNLAIGEEWRLLAANLLESLALQGSH